MITLSAISLLTLSCSKQKQTSENVIKVKTVEASSTFIYGSESYSETIEENSGESLSFPVGGTIKQLNVTEGQSVGAGQLVAVLDATTLGNLVSASSAAVGQAQAAVEQARAGLAQAEKSAAQALDAYKRMKQLHDNGSLPEIKWVEVQTQYQQAQDAVNQVRQQVNQAEAAVQSAKAQKNISLKNLHKSSLPSGVLALQVQDDFGDASSLLITLESNEKTYRELNTYMDNLKERLRNIESVGRLTVYGNQLLACNEWNN